jgi:protein ImuA
MSAITMIERLRQQIHLLENAQMHFSRTVSVADAVDAWLPHGGLSAGCIHEVKGSSLASTIAFSAILSARLAGEDGNVLYIAPDRLLHPLGLLPYGVKPERILHISPRRTQDLAWAVMEALRCAQVSSVIALLGGLDQTASRRLQLAAEESGATGFLLGQATSAPVASVITRWKVSSIAARSNQRFDEPVWAVDLLYCRGGRPGNWILEWRGQKLHCLASQQPVQSEPHSLAV